MLKRNWHYLLLLGLLTDLGYSFWQYLQFPLDGDLAPIVWPGAWYSPVLHDPFGLRALLHNEVYAAPNRFFSHFFLFEYFRHVPLWLHPLLSPLDSVYMACALLKLAIHALIVYVLAMAVSNRRNVLSTEFLLAAVLVTPLLQASGFSGQMGVVDWSVTYVAFYALPVSLLLLFLLPFVREAVHGAPVRLSALGYLGMAGLAVVLAFSGPVIPAAVLLICPAALLWRWYRQWAAQSVTEPWLPRAGRAFRAVPRPHLVLFSLISLLSLYSLYIGQNNSENMGAIMPIAQRYARLPMGVYHQLTGKLGLPLLLVLLLTNAWLLRQVPAGGPARKALRYLGLFALIYTLLLPLGGFRSYREDILRRDSILPIIIGMIGCFAWSAYCLLKLLPAPTKRRYVAFIAIFLAIFTITDKPRARDFNAGERRLLTMVAQSPEQIVRLPTGCTVMAWQPLPDYHQSELNGQLLQYWGITDTLKYYYQQ